MFGALIAQLDAIAAAFDAAQLTGAQAAKAVDDIGLIRRLLDGMLLGALARVDQTKAYGSSRDTAHFYAEVVRGDASEGRRMLTTARKLQSLPMTNAAVRDGALSAKQAAMVVDAVERNPAAEVTLLQTIDRGVSKLRDACLRARAEAEDSTARAKRQHAARELSMWTDDDGMLAGRFRLTPEVGAKVKTALDTATRRIFRERRTTGEHEAFDAYAADALAAAVLDGGTVKVTETVHVVVDHAVLVRGEALPGERCEIPGVGPVSADYARSLLGTAFVTAIVTKGKDITTVAHLGRHVPAELQTAMIVGGRECEVDGCDHHGYLERDHVHEYAVGGPTSYDNLAWLCYTHHRRKTDGWHLGPPHPSTRKRTLTAPERANAPPG